MSGRAPEGARVRLLLAPLLRAPVLLVLLLVRLRAVMPRAGPRRTPEGGGDWSQESWMAACKQSTRGKGLREWCVLSLASPARSTPHVQVK